MFRVFWLCFLCAMLVHSPAHAQGENELIRFGPAESWVERVEPPAQPSVLPDGVEHAMDILSVQQRFTAQSSKAYYRFRSTFQNTQAVLSNDSFYILIDPRYQHVVVHHVDVYRGGQRIRYYPETEFQSSRLQPGGAGGAYDKRILLSYFMPDLRAGDTLDVAYTIHGRKPELGRHFAATIDLHYPLPAAHMLHRVLVRGGAPAPRVETRAGLTEYRWEQRDAMPAQSEDAVPSWYAPAPRAQITSFQSWAEIGALLAPFYALPDQKADYSLVRAASDILAEHSEEKAQARAALEYVQKAFRHVPVLPEVSGYAPRGLKTVLQNGFGDSQDLVLVLRALLAQLDIASTPVLVNSALLGQVGRLPPRHDAFNYAVLRVTIDGQEYFVDPSRGVQLGALETLAQANFALGLEIAAPSRGLIELNAPAAAWDRVTTTTFDIDETSQDIEFTVTTASYGAVADYVNDVFKRSGTEAFEKEYLAYFADQYADVEQLGYLAVTVDDDEARVRLTARYKIRDAWTADKSGTRETFVALPFMIYDDLPPVIGGARSAPYALAYPLRIKDVHVFQLAEDWDITARQRSEDTTSFSYQHEESFEKGVLRAAYAYRTKIGHIPAASFQDSMAVINSVYDDIGTSLERPTAAATALAKQEEEALSFSEKLQRLGPWAEENIEAIGMAIGAILTIVFGVLIAALCLQAAAKDLPWRGEAVFYPVSLPVFLLLSIATGGLYGFYWALKNWQWLKTQQGRAIWPPARALFMPLTNVALFHAVAKHAAPERAGAGLPLSIMLAALYLATVVGQFYLPDRLSLAPLALGIVILAVPAARIAGLNARRPDIIQRYSRFGWEKVLTLVVGLLMWGITLIGFVLPD